MARVEKAERVKTATNVAEVTVVGESDADVTSTEARRLALQAALELGITKPGVDKVVNGPAASEFSGKVSLTQEEYDAYVMEQRVAQQAGEAKARRVYRIRGEIAFV